MNLGFRGPLSKCAGKDLFRRHESAMQTPARRTWLRTSTTASFVPAQSCGPSAAYQIENLSCLCASYLIMRVVVCTGVHPCVQAQVSVVNRRAYIHSCRSRNTLCRLMEAAVWAASRWADTYLLSEEEGLAPALDAAFGARGGGPALAGFLVQASLTLLVGWPGED